MTLHFFTVRPEQRATQKLLAGFKAGHENQFECSFSLDSHAEKFRSPQFMDVLENPGDAGVLA